MPVGLALGELGSPGLSQLAPLCYPQGVSPGSAEAGRGMPSP